MEIVMIKKQGYGPVKCMRPRIKEVAKKII